MGRLRGPLSHRRAIGLFLPVLALVCLIAPASARADSTAGLAGRLDEAIRQVDAARDGGAPLGDPSTLFPETEEVVWRDAVVRVDHSGLRAEWRAVPAGGEARRQALDRLRDRLAAVRAEIVPADAIETPPPQGWQAKLSEIMSRPEFAKRQAQESLFVRLMQWLRDKLDFLLPRGTEQAVGKVMGRVIYVLAGAALLFMLVLLARAAFPLFRRDTRAALQGSPSGPARAETPEGLLALAEGRARAGDLRGALQATFRWMLLTLHQAGRLEYDPALTNREHLARLKTDAALRAAFEDLSRRFEVAWYALRPVGPEDYSAFRAGCQMVAGGRA